MTPPTLHATPRPRDVLREQLRAVGLALRGPGLAAAALLGVVTLAAAIRLLGARTAIDFHPELSMLPGMVGALLPIGVWKGEERFGAGVLWSLPVDRRRHALVRVGAGWVWLMAAVAVLVLSLLALSLLSGGSVLAERTVRVLPALPVPAPPALDPAALRAVRWTPNALLWLVPFTAATASYLLASALALGTRHPLRWIVGTLLAPFLLFAFGDLTDAARLKTAIMRVLPRLFEGPYGIDTLFTARAESLHTEVRLTTGETVGVWRDLPDVAQWALTTLLWTGAGALALWAAASRHRERRRG